MSSDNERMQILQMIEDAQITAAEGLRRLDALATAAPAAPSAEPEPAQAEKMPPDPGLEHWRRWWIIPLWIGTAILLFGALLMFAAYQAGGFGFWFILATLPFILGVIVMALAASSRSARWLHIRIRNAEGAREGRHSIALSFPLPIRLTAWALRIAGPHIPQLKDRGVDELILALAESTSAESPLYVDVNGGEGGEHVQVFIG